MGSRDRDYACLKSYFRVFLTFLAIVESASLAKAMLQLNFQSIVNVDLNMDVRICMQFCFD